MKNKNKYMKKKEFIQWLVKKEREAESGFSLPRFVKVYKNSEDLWEYRKPGVDCFENTIDLKTDGKVIYFYDSDIFNGEDTWRKKEFTYEEFINTNIDEIE